MVQSEREVGVTGVRSPRMVCDDCTRQLSVIAAPDPWKAGSTSAGAARRVDENKALRKGVRSKCVARSRVAGAGERQVTLTDVCCP